MQQTVYKCDNCVLEIGQKEHISLRLGSNSGIAVPPGVKQGNGSTTGFWTTTPSLNGKFIHFCSIKCLGDYFKSLMGGRKVKK